MSNKLKKKPRISREAKKIIGRSMRLNVCRYTFDAWMACYPESNEEEWTAKTFPGDPYEFAYNIFDTYGLTEDQTVQIVTLDETYFDWLKKTGRENNEMTRAFYANSVSDDIATALYKLDLDNSPIEVFFLSVVVIVPEPKTSYSFHLSEKTCTALKEYFGQIWGAENIYLPGYVLKLDTMFNDQDRIYDMAVTYFDDHIQTKLGKYDEQECTDGVNLIQLAIPVCIKLGRNTAVFHHPNTLSSLEVVQGAPDMLLFDRETLTELELTDIEDFESSGIESLIKEAFPGVEECSIMPGLVHVDEIPELNDAFVKNLKKNAKKYGTAVVLK